LTEKIKVQICDFCRSCNIDTLEVTKHVYCFDCDRVIRNSEKETVLVEKECVDCGIETDYAVKH
jgi:hypothetical protein